MLRCVCLGWSLPSRDLHRAIPWLQQPRQGKGIAPLSASQRHPVGWPLGGGGQGAGGPGRQQGGRGGGWKPSGQPAARLPRCSGARGCPAALGDGVGSGSSSSRARSAATVRPGGRGRGKTTTHRRRQSEGSALRARPREPNRPLPERAISRPQSSRRLSQASAGFARTLPLAALESPTPPAPPDARLGCAHGRLTLCRRRSCCRPDRRRYRSPPFAVSAPRGTRVNEEGPRNITPPRPAAGAVRSAA